MTLAIIIAAYVLIGLAAGFFAGRDSWQNGNPDAQHPWDRYPPHQAGRSVFWALAAVVFWGIFLAFFAAWLLADVGRSAINSERGRRFLNKVWGE